VRAGTVGAVVAACRSARRWCGRADRAAHTDAVRVHVGVCTATGTTGYRRWQLDGHGRRYRRRLRRRDGGWRRHNRRRHHRRRGERGGHHGRGERWHDRHRRRHRNRCQSRHRHCRRGARRDRGRRHNAGSDRGVRQRRRAHQVADPTSDHDHREHTARDPRPSPSALGGWCLDRLVRLGDRAPLRTDGRLRIGHGATFIIFGRAVAVRTWTTR